MAQVPYEEGVPQVAPRESVPDDYQHIQARPEQFGALLAHGEQQLGAGALQAGKFFGEVAADNASNEFQERTTKLLYGDPQKSVTGPDGKPQQDTGFYGLKGRAALDARPGVTEQLDQSLQEIRAGLQTPEQQLQFDNFSRRYRSLVDSEIGRHADQQANTWYSEVNDRTAKQQLDLISTNAGNPDVVAHATSDLINARVKQAELQGGGDELRPAAIAQAKREAAMAQVQGVVGTGDYAKAQRMVENYRPLLGVEYEKLATEVRARAEQQNGTNAGQNAIASANLAHPFANAGLPVWSSATAAAPGGFSPYGLARTIKIESGGNPNAANGNAVGLGQFMPATWDKFGQGDRKDPQQAILATQRYAAANAQALKGVLGRDPTDAELYLAHQQGAEGATRLLMNPNVRAGTLVGDAAIRGNGGDPNAPAFMFTNMWVGRFNGSQGWQVALGPGAIPERPSVRADAYQRILDDPDLNPNERQHALSYVHTTLAAQEIAENNSATANKQIVSDAADEYTKAIHSGHGSPEMVAKLVTDPRFNSDWKTRDTLINLARSQSGDDIAGASMQYGPGFWSAYKSITAPLGDPTRITDPTALLPRAGPGGDITLAGLDRLTKTMGEMKRSVDDTAVHTAKAGLLDYAKSKLSFDQEMLFPGVKPLADPKGKQIFDARFIPKFEAAYDAWVKDGKNPWEFLTQKNVDELMQGMRSKTEMAMDKISARDEATGEKIEQIVPPPLPGVDPTKWSEVMAERPITPSGRPVHPDRWAEALRILRDDPSEENLALFKKHWPDVDTKKIIDKLGAAPGKKPEEKPKPKKEEPPAPADTRTAEEIIRSGGIPYEMIRPAPNEGATFTEGTPNPENLEKLIRSGIPYDVPKVRPSEAGTL